MLIDNIGNVAAIGWSVSSSTGYTMMGETIVPRVGDPFYGSDYLGLSRYGIPTNTNLDTLTQQLQAIISKSAPAPYTLSKATVEKVLRDNVQNWNFLYANGTSPRPRNWEQSFGNYLKIIITDDGRLTFDRDEEPPHNHPQIHHMVDNVNYYVQQFSDKPYIVLIDHLKRLGKGWRTPDKGSLWHVIHTGDVNFAKVSDFITKLPGLDTFLATFGLSTETLQQFAEGFLTPGGNAVNPTVPVPNNKVDIGQNNNNFFMDNKPMLLAGGAGIATYLATKKPLYGLIAAAGVYFLMQGSGGGGGTDKKQFILNWIATSSDSAASQQQSVNAINSMSSSEISDVYTFIKDYFMTGTQLDSGNPLFARINAISAKYNIFT